MKSLKDFEYFKTETGVLYRGDCLQIMPLLKNNFIDLILCDLPYGTTACKWDEIIPFEPLWTQYKRLTKDNAPIVLTASQPFTSKLILSNIEEYRHAWVWNKNNSAGFVTAKIRPFAICEDIIVFCKNKANYYPIMEVRGEPRNKGGYSYSEVYNITPSKSLKKSNSYYPKNLINISNASQVGKVHPTQKPIALFEYLIKTYTKTGEVVLDNCLGSGTTALACESLKRRWIGIEISKKY